jgi:hypothetical protein
LLIARTKEVDTIMSDIYVNPPEDEEEEDTKGWDREDDALVQETEIQIEREEGEDYGWGEND